ncbi:polyketide cyclase [Camelimonas fluminis]|uniref:Cyclase family protein n=1 Tax=Camelimonas fluminis TaxID=1576911 RepID=A0ABV7UK99_9HYPH|nr:cyclase family protein [Camelimonas fluminis]GHE59483.1 polyketide cyclase [Camelimonas fluminis]
MTVVHGARERMTAARRAGLGAALALAMAAAPGGALLAKDDAAPAGKTEQDWTKSKWGPKDEVGAANYQTPELVKKAADLVKTGKVYNLAMESNLSLPAYEPRKMEILVVQPAQAGPNGVFGPNKATYNDDMIVGWNGAGTHIDGLGHLGVDHVYYNGHKIHEFADIKGLKKLGLEKFPPVVARGVLLDIAALKGVDMLKEGTPINSKEIEEAAKKQGVEIRQGDVVLLHTGWADMIGKDNKKYIAVQPGLGMDGARYLTGKGVIAIGSDTAALEVLPGETKDLFPVHQELLARKGTYILENIVTKDLAADKASEFMVILSPPRITGSVQAIFTPVAVR